MTYSYSLDALREAPELSNITAMSGVLKSCWRLPFVFSSRPLSVGKKK